MQTDENNVTGEKEQQSAPDAQPQETQPNDDSANEAKAEAAATVAGEFVSPAKPKQEKKKKNVKKEIISWILTLGSAVIIALLIRTFIFEPIFVDGHSMMDTLQDREVMIVTKLEYIFGEPQRGDVVICKYPGRTENFVKRLMAVPGDTIEIKDHVVYVNGEAVDEPYLNPEYNDDADTADMDLITLGDDQYFVMGDNRDNSHDCRNYYGYGKPTTLTRSQIIAHVRCVIYPFSSIRKIE